MFGYAAIAIATSISAFNEIKLIELENKMFEQSISRLSLSEKADAREKRRIEKREERMHRELCQAIRDSQQ